MAAPLIRIDPALPVCWEDPQTLRFGFDRAEARIAQPSARTQRLIGALSAGIAPDQLDATLRRLGATRPEWRRLARRLADVLVLDAPPEPPATLRVGVAGTGPSVPRLLGALVRAGFSAVAVAPEHDDGDEGDELAELDLLVIAERFLGLPLGIAAGAAPPQLVVRFADRGLRVGPILCGAGSPCPSCITLHDVDADPALPVIAAQLLGRMPAAETPASAEAAAALAVTLIQRWLADPGAGEPQRLRVAVRGGIPDPVPVVETVEAHPECGCALGAAAAAPPLAAVSAVA